MRHPTRIRSGAAIGSPVVAARAAPTVGNEPSAAT